MNTFAQLYMMFNTFLPFYHNNYYTLKLTFTFCLLVHGIRMQLLPAAAVVLFDASSLATKCMAMNACRVGLNDKRNSTIRLLSRVHRKEEELYIYCCANTLWILVIKLSL